jgi:glycine/D-amino acid oxidase-like deaminating enzyme
MLNNDFQTKSFWLTTRKYSPNGPLNQNLDVDVAIVGGGFSGLSTAYHLKKADPNIRVALFESEALGYGASGRNGGFSMSKIGMMHSITQMRFGRAKTIEAHEYAEKAVQYHKQLITELGIDCEYEYPGLLWTACNEKQANRLEREADLVINKLGLKGIEFIDAPELKSRVNSPLYVGGAWWEPASGMLNPAKMVWGWKEIIESLGVQVFEQCPVTDFTKTGNRFRLDVLGAGKPHTVTADKVVLSVNAWSHSLPKIKHKQAPLFTYIILTEPLSDRQLESIGWEGRETIEDFRDLVHYYRLTSDNRILYGGRDVGASWGKRMHYDSNEKMFTALKNDLFLQFPGLKGVNITHKWGGPVSVCMDFFPALGYAGDKNLIFSLGWAGHGVSLTQLNGQTLADLALERDTDLTRVFFVNRKTIPLPPEPLRRAAFQAVASFMRWEDRRMDVF